MPTYYGSKGSSTVTTLEHHLTDLLTTARPNDSSTLLCTSVAFTLAPTVSDTQTNRSHSRILKLTGEKTLKLEDTKAELVLIVEPQLIFRDEASRNACRALWENGRSPGFRMSTKILPCELIQQAIADSSNETKLNLTDFLGGSVGQVLPCGSIHLGDVTVACDVPEPITIWGLADDKVMASLVFTKAH